MFIGACVRRGLLGVSPQDTYTRCTVCVDTFRIGMSWKRYKNILVSAAKQHQPTHNIVTYLANLNLPFVSSPRQSAAHAKCRWCCCSSSLWFFVYRNSNSWVILGLIAACSVFWLRWFLHLFLCQYIKSHVVNLAHFLNQMSAFVLCSFSFMFLYRCVHCARFASANYVSQLRACDQYSKREPTYAQYYLFIYLFNFNL
jgi:hypothetical protein